MKKKYETRIKGIIRHVIDKHKRKTSDERKKAGSNNQTQNRITPTHDNADDYASGEDDDNPINSTVRTECLRLLYARKGASIRDAHHEVPSETNENDTDGGRDWQSSDNENDSPPQTKKMKMMCESGEHADENDDDDDDDDRTKYSRLRKQQLTNIEKTVANSGSSHRGEKVGRDFFDKKGKLVERKTVREYIREQIGARRILNLSGTSIANVVSRFSFNVEEAKDPNYHSDYKTIIKLRNWE